MQMDAGLDTGPVFSSRTIPIAEQDTSPALQERLAHLGAELLVKDLPAIIAGSIAAAPQPAEGVTYAHKITSSQCLVEWTKSAEDIARQVRAFCPHPGSHTMWSGRRLKILQARVITTGVSDSLSLPPGTVVRANTDSFTIRCGNGGLLAIEEVQLEGKKRMATAEFLRGVHLAPGTQLGDSTPSKA
jgi:methionyl-tRNA formyltransferase